MATTPQPSSDTDATRPLLTDSESSESYATSLRKKTGQLYEKYFPNKSKTTAKDLSLHPPYKEPESSSIIFKAVVGIVLYFVIGILSFYLAEEDLFGTKTTRVIDALYFSVVTLTTVGYGDLVPGNTGGKLFTCAYVFLGFGLVGALVSAAANYMVEKQEQIVVHTIKRKEVKGYEHAEYEHAEAATWKAYVTGVLVLVFGVIGLGFLLIVEKMSFIDAFYCVCVTVTTLGYGDHTFVTPVGRLFAAVWLLCSTACVAQLFLYIAEMRTENRQLQLAHWVLHRKTTKVDLEAADMDGDGVVSASEFVIFKLKELGKIDNEDVSDILEEFHALDYDRSGSISTHDSHFE